MDGPGPAPQGRIPGCIAVAGPFDAQTRQVIEEYLDQPDLARMKTIATMLRGAPCTVVWDADFVRICLRAADACGEKSLNAVRRKVTTPDWQSDNYEVMADGPPPTSWDEYAQTGSAEWGQMLADPNVGEPEMRRRVLRHGDEP